MFALLNQYDWFIKSAAKKKKKLFQLQSNKGARRGKKIAKNNPISTPSSLHIHQFRRLLFSKLVISLCCQYFFHTFVLILFFFFAFFHQFENLLQRKKCRLRRRLQTVRSSIFYCLKTNLNLGI